MFGLNIKLADLQISDFHAPECCFLWWHTAPEWHFQCSFENNQVNVWSKHKACWLANIWFSCSRMLFFVMTYRKNLQLLGALPPHPYQGLCPWTPLGAYCGPQTPASFSSFFTFPQFHVCIFKFYSFLVGWLLFVLFCSLYVFQYHVENVICSICAIHLIKIHSVSYCWQWIWHYSI